MRFRILSLAAFLLLGAASAYPQYVTTPASEAHPEKDDGVFYSLPKNIIRVSVVVEETQNHKGPYSDYCSKFLGTSDYIKSDSKSYRIVDVNTAIGVMPDKDAQFFVYTKQTDEKNKTVNYPLSICLTDEGLLAGVGYSNFELKNESKITRTVISNSEEIEFKYFAEQNFFKTADTTVRKITIDTTVVFINDIQDTIAYLTFEQKAKRAAQKLSLIRENRFNIITGFNEVPYEHNTVLVMSNELRKMEKEYLELFVGKSVKRLVEKQFYIIPERGRQQQTVCRFSKETGFEGQGEELTISFSPAGQQTNRIPDATNNRIICRNPLYSTISITYKAEKLCENHFPISQFGEYVLVPLNGTKLIINPKNGQVINIDK